jgi:hypothetical protein
MPLVITITGRLTPRVITITGRLTPRVITGVRPATFIITILVGATDTGGIITGGTTEIGNRRHLETDSVLNSPGPLF